TRAFKFYFTNKSMKNPLTTHLLLALSRRLSFSNKPLRLSASPQRMQLGFEKEENSVSSFGATGTQKGGLPG
ncbi:hypothetical protein QQF64_021814, partial [Cirrhinus molitorella]